MKNLNSEDLITNYLEGKSTPEQSARLETWYLLQAEQAADPDIQLDDEAIDSRMWQNIQQAIDNNRKDRVPVRRLRPRSVLIRWAVAAAVLIICGWSALYFMQGSPAVQRFAISKEKDIAPGGNSAFLILSNGKKVDLSSAGNGTILAENGLSIVKTKSGQIVYHVKPGKAETNAVNTIETPVGGQYMIVLPDGSKVWLNSASALTYPTVFSKEQRRVSLVGEGYFEIAHFAPASGQPVPFVVKVLKKGKTGQEVKVLGTHFNINSYPDEPAVTTTLFQGKVAVSSATAKTAVLKPGQQSILKGSQLEVSAADTEMALAWKNGEFVFREDLGSAMRKVARWYDVEVIYEESAPKQLMLGGWMSRETNISAILDHIQSTGKVHFRIEGRRVIVSK